MSIIKEKIKYKGKDLNLQFSLDGDNNLLGYQQEINNYSLKSTIDSINEGDDVEIKRFKYKNENVSLKFSFWNGTTYSNTFTSAGFTNKEVSGGSENFLNSYFILDFYDSYDINNQKRIFSQYLTKLNQNNNSIFQVNSKLQLYNINVPINYYTQMTGNTITGYTRFSFYNAKTGKIQLFNNEKNINLTTPQISYFESILNLNDMTWNVSDIYLGTVISAKESVNNAEYIKKYNNAIDNYDDVQVVCPIGNTSNYDDAKYDTID